METDYGDNDSIVWEIEMEVPYGTYEAQLLYKKTEAEEGDDNFEYKEVPAAKLELFYHTCEPIPISRQQQQELDDKEEKENKERETEARLAQKKLEEEKARLRIEQQQ